jgi:hypothetical protein
MYEAKAHPDDNYLLVTLEGMMQLEEARAAVAAILAEGRQMRRGFTIISDIRKARAAPPEVAEVIKSAQVALFALGAANAIRVVGDAAAASLQFQRTQREANVQYDSHIVASLEEAHALHRKLARAAAAPRAPR